MKCIECGHELSSTTNKSETIIKCENCGWTAVTTNMDEIFDDLTKYSIIISNNNVVDKEILIEFSKISGQNIICSKKILNEGGIMMSDIATEIKKIIEKLEIMGIEFSIEPPFPY